MADGTQVKPDFSAWDAALAQLVGPARISLARSMGVAGGEVLRDEAKLRAPIKDGVLQSAIYLAFRDTRSNDRVVMYSVSWNAKKAPHGHLLEFGHWQPYAIRKLPDGRVVTDKTVLLAQPKWIAAHPFLRPAWDARHRAREAMLQRGRERLPELLAGIKAGTTG